MNNIFKIFKKELRETFRDKKSLAMMLVIPLFIPLVVIGMSALFDSEQTQQADNAKKMAFAYDLSDVEKNIADNLNLDLLIGTQDELKEKLEDGEIDYYIYRLDNKFIINRKQSTSSSYLVETFINSYKTYVQSNFLIDNGIDPNNVLSIVTTEENIIDEGEEASNPFVDYMVQYSFIFVIMAITISASYPATDATAGERERGTLETILTFPLKARDIIMGKYLNISICSMVTGLLSFALAAISLIIAGNSFDMYSDANLMMSFQSIAIGVIAIILYSFMLSGIYIAIASKCKTFKEAQSALTPIQFVSYLPSFIAFLVGVKNSILLSLIPFLNISLVFGDSVENKLDMLSVLGMIGSSIVIIVLFIVLIIKQYKSEKVLFAQ